MTAPIVLNAQNVDATVALLKQWSTAEGLSSYYKHIQELKAYELTTVSRIYYGAVVIGNLILSSIIYACSRLFITHRGMALAGAITTTGVIAYRVSLSASFPLLKTQICHLIAVRTSAHKQLKVSKQQQQDAIKVVTQAYFTKASYIGEAACKAFSRISHLDSAKELTRRLQTRYEDGSLFIAPNPNPKGIKPANPPSDYPYHQKLFTPATPMASFNLDQFFDLDELLLSTAKKLQLAARFFVYGKDVHTQTEPYCQVSVLKDAVGFNVQPWK